MTEEEMNIVARATLAGFHFWRAVDTTKSSDWHWYYSSPTGVAKGGGIYTLPRAAIQALPEQGMYTLPRAAIQALREHGLVSDKEARDYLHSRTRALAPEDVDIEALQALAMAEALATPDAPQT